jgi:hypothetical protein
VLAAPATHWSVDEEVSKWTAEGEPLEVKSRDRAEQRGNISFAGFGTEAGSLLTLQKQSVDVSFPSEYHSVDIVIVISPLPKANPMVFPGQIKRQLQKFILPLTKAMRGTILQVQYSGIIKRSNGLTRPSMRISLRIQLQAAELYDAIALFCT